MTRNNLRVFSTDSNLHHLTTSPELIAIITQDTSFRNILARLPVYAESDLPILLTGEPGTGKELVAGAVCALNPLRQPCLLMNCAALTESLAGSELFGHLKGAFTDALNERRGKFRLANGGTLFLDEVGDLPLTIQSKLLRAVEQGEIEPVGGDAPLQVDVRLLAATNQDLPRLISQGQFRRDLYDRLAVLEIHLPPLRDRDGDIALLARHFAHKTASLYGRGLPELSRAALRRLERYGWPGNVRELKNVITRAVLLNRGGPVCEEDIYFNSKSSWAETATPHAAQEVPPTRPSRSRLQELLSQDQGNISALSRRLRVCTKTVYRWLRSYQIDLDRIREGAGSLSWHWD